MYANVKSLCSTPEINITLYVNYISIKKNWLKKKKERSFLLISEFDIFSFLFFFK